MASWTAMAFATWSMLWVRVMSSPSPTSARSYELDWTGRFRGTTPAVVRPGSALEVAGVIEILSCSWHRRSCPRVGTLAWWAAASRWGGEIVVSLRRLDDVGVVDEVWSYRSPPARARRSRRCSTPREQSACATPSTSARSWTGDDRRIDRHKRRWHQRHAVRRNACEQVLGVEAVFGTGQSTRRVRERFG